MVLVFSFWQLSYSKWIIIIAAGLIFLFEIFRLFKSGCEGNCFGGCKTGSELIMEKGKPVKSKPSKEEVVETLKKKK